MSDQEPVSYARRANRLKKEMHDEYELLPTPKPDEMLWLTNKTNAERFWALWRIEREGTIPERLKAISLIWEFGRERPRAPQLSKKEATAIVQDNKIDPKDNLSMLKKALFINGINPDEAIKFLFSTGDKQ